MQTLPISRSEEIAKRLFCVALKAVVEKDTDYRERFIWILQAMRLAAELDYEVGFRIDPAEPDWPVAFIHLPGFGSTSWHTAAFPHNWDGHTTEEKFARIAAYIQQNSSGSPTKPLVIGGEIVAG